MIRYFVTATGTDVGKTFVTAAIAAKARASGRSVLALKPVASGFEDDNLEDTDPGILLRAQGVDRKALDCVSPWRFRAPQSPDMAAAREARAIEFEQLVGFCQTSLDGPADTVVIEGVGGVMVPLDDRHTILDLMTRLRIPVVLVAGSYLGTLSHTLTALRVLAAERLDLRAIVLDETPGSTVLIDDTAATLARFATRVPVIVLKRRSGVDAWREVPELAELLG